MKKILAVVLMVLFICATVQAIEIVRQKNVATYITFPVVDGNGDPVTAISTPDSEIDTWADGSAPDGFTDCTNEATELGVTGIYYLSLTQTEMNNDYIYIQIKSTSSIAKVQHILIRTMTGDPLALSTFTASTDSVTIDKSNAWNLGVTVADSVTVDKSNAWGLGVEVNTKTGFSLASPQTFDLTGNITGNLSGSIGSVTGEVKVLSTDTLTTLLGNVNGSVGSVAGAVGSVTGEVKVLSTDTLTTILGNVNGSVASVTGEVKVLSTDTITTILGNVNGSVASVSGAVGSVTNEVKILSTDTITTVLGNVNGNVGGNVTGSVGSVTNGVTLADDAITAAKIYANAIGASELASDAVQEIVDANWVESTSGYETINTFAFILKYGAFPASTFWNYIDNYVWANVDTTLADTSLIASGWLATNIGGGSCPTATTIANAVLGRDTTTYASDDSAGKFGHAILFSGGVASLPDSTAGDISGLANHIIGVYVDSISDEEKHLIALYSDSGSASAFPDSSADQLSDLANHKAGVYVDSTKDNYINDKKIAASAITSSEAPNLDAAVSSRSTLTTSDNIGINWGDVSNPTTTVGLTGTSIKRSADDYAMLYHGTYGLANIYDWLVNSVYYEVASINGWNPANGTKVIGGGMGACTTLVNPVKVNGAASAVYDTTGKAFWNLSFGTSFTAGSMGDSINNATYVQGTASSLTNAGIATAVRDTAENRPDIFTDQTSGAGSEQETLYVLDGDGNAVECNVTWFNSTNTPCAWGATNVDGYKIFQLNPATYTVAVTALTIHNELDTITISADGRDTILVVAQATASSPGSDSICVEGWLFGEDYTKPTTGAKVIFSVQQGTLMDTSVTPHVLIEKFSKGVQATVTDSGYFRIYLPASINLVPWKQYLEGHWTSSDTVFYDMEIKRGTNIIWEKITNIFIPDTTGCLNTEDLPFR